MCTFFDLVQEFDSFPEFYHVCVTALKEFMGVDSRFYLLNETGGTLELVCDSHHCERGCESVVVPDYIYIAESAYEINQSYVVPINRKPSVDDDHAASLSKSLILGMLEVYPSANLTEADRFFICKYTNRIGYNLHNRIIAEQNIRHLKFINNLVMDIEHNVIIPSIHFKYLFHKLKRKIKEFDNLKLHVLAMKKSGNMAGNECDVVLKEITTLHKDLELNHKNLFEHYTNYALFIESLFRRDHFQKGHLVLHYRQCLIEKEIIKPQLAYYSSRFAARNITVKKPDDMAAVEISLRVDVGLLSQVYANLFSNVVKYTAKVVDHQQKVKKVMAYGRDMLPDYFGPHNDGVKFNVFTTGAHLTAEEMRAVFIDGFRGEKSKNIDGTGHGLSFIKQVIEIHGGEVGCEPTAEGNNFFFILPVSVQETVVYDDCLKGALKKVPKCLSG